MQLLVNLFNSLGDRVLHFWKGLVDFTEISDIFVGCAHVLVGLLIEGFEVVRLLMILTLKFNIEPSHIVYK